jgi:hypothetical protein
MHEEHLTTDEHAAGCIDCKRFFAELKKLARKGARIYSLPAYNGDQAYQLTTTSKELFLGLGRLTQRSRDHLCNLLCGALSQGRGMATFTLPSFTDDGETRNDRSLLVSCSEEADDGTYLLHLSPA